MPVLRPLTAISNLRWSSTTNTAAISSYILAGMVHSALIHSRLRDGKVWIEADGTEEGVAPTSQVRGVAKQDIVLAFYSEAKRRHTEFSVA